MHGMSQTPTSPELQRPRDQPNLGIRALHHAVSATPIGIAFLFFCGNGYYGRLFKEFGLKPSVLEVSQIDIATMGFYSVCYAWYTIIRDNAWLWIKSALLGVGVAGIVLILLLLVPRMMSLFAPLAPIAKRIDQINRRILWAMLALLFVLGGLGGGDLAGSYDAKAIQKGRSAARSCYVVDGIPYRATILAQDKDRTILVHPDRTSLVSNEKLSFVASCTSFAGIRTSSPKG